METFQSRTVVDDLIFPEGIRWHQDKIWFSDILDFKVYSHDPVTGRTEVVAETEDRPSGLGFLPDGSLLIATMGGRTLLRRDPDGLKLVADLKGICMLLNDMVVDAKGRAYVDAYFDGLGSPDMTKTARGGIVLVEPDGSYRIVVDDMKLPNGLAITEDGRTMVACDYVAGTLVTFDIAANGSLSNRRLFADFGSASPDGMCLDAEGAAWVSFPEQGRFRRILSGGTVTHEIAYKGKSAIALVLGGRDRRSLYLCTAEMDAEIGIVMRKGRAARPHCKGRIEIVDGIKTPGAGRP